MERLHHRRAPLGLDREEARGRAADPFHADELLVPLRDAHEAGAAAGRIEQHVGHAPVELLGELETHRLLAFEAVGFLQRREIEPLQQRRDLRHDLPRGGDGALDREHMRARDLRLGDRGRRRPARHDDRHGQTGARAVHGCGAPRVPRRRNHEPGRAEGARPRDRHPEPARLERSRRILAFVLGPQPPEAEVRREPRQR